MENTRLFFQFLQKFVELTEDEFNEQLKPYLVTRNFKRKELLSKAGEVENYMNFITKGLVRKYYKKERKRSTHKFPSKGTLFTARNHFTAAAFLNIL